MKNTIIKAALGAVTLGSAIFASSSASAQTSDFGVTSDCPTLIAQTEARRNIPRGLLMAIALTESGTGGSPSPYAMNIAGRSHFARSGQEMANIISANWSRGVRSIDVGCMQINLKYHGGKFPRLTDLLNSTTNVEYGASYLIRLATASGSWKDAVMSYHNKNNPTRRAWYGCKVWNNYLAINRARDGYLQCPDSPNGSSTASRQTMAGPPKTSEEVRNAWAKATGAGPLTRPTQVATSAQVQQGVVGGQTVDIPIPVSRPVGTITLAAPGEDLAEVAHDDSREAAFKSVRPISWAGRAQANANPQPEAPRTQQPATRSSFGRVRGE